MYERDQKKVLEMCQVVLKSELIASSKVFTVYSFAVPVVNYNVSVLNWNMREMKMIDMKFPKGKSH